MTISSGAYVISPTAAALIEPEQRFDITDLFRSVRHHELKVAAFEHDSKWIDINDVAALQQAETLFAESDVGASG